MSDPLTSGNNPLSPAATRRLRFAALIVLAILTIAVAAWLNQGRRARDLQAQVANAIASADGMRMTVALYRARNGGAWPYDNSQAGLLSLSAISGKYIEDAHIENGRIVITLGGQSDAALRGKRIVLSPYLQVALVLWHCASTDVASGLLPENCR